MSKEDALFSSSLILEYNFNSRLLRLINLQLMSVKQQSSSEVLICVGIDTFDLAIADQEHLIAS
jgi:hypothetical protein